MIVDSKGYPNDALKIISILIITDVLLRKL